MLNNKLTKSQRELFCNLKAFLYTKAKNFTPIQEYEGYGFNPRHTR
ncbi:integrase [Helicobacter pylori]|nr:integrase [Helicobacter pylori]